MSKDEAEASKERSLKKIFILDVPELKDFSKKVIEVEAENRFAFEMLLDFAIAEKQEGEARELLDQLKKIDAIRVNYWEFRRRGLFKD